MFCSTCVPNRPLSATAAQKVGKKKLRVCESCFTRTSPGRHLVSPAAPSRPCDEAVEQSLPLDDKFTTGEPSRVQKVSKRAPMKKFTSSVNAVTLSGYSHVIIIIIIVIELLLLLH